MDSESRNMAGRSSRRQDQDAPVTYGQEFGNIEVSVARHEKGDVYMRRNFTRVKNLTRTSMWAVRRVAGGRNRLMRDGSPLGKRKQDHVSNDSPPTLW